MVRFGPDHDAEPSARNARVKLSGPLALKEKEGDPWDRLVSLRIGLIDMPRNVISRDRQRGTRPKWLDGALLDGLHHFQKVSLPCLYSHLRFCLAHISAYHHDSMIGVRVFVPQIDLRD